MSLGQEQQENNFEGNLFITSFRDRSQSNIDKKKICRELRRIERHDVYLVFKNAESMKEVKSDSTIQKIVSFTRTPSCFISNMVIGEEIMKDEENTKDIHMAIKLETHHGMSIGTLINKLYKIFPEYHGEIFFNKNDKSSYVVKARNILAPFMKKDIDPDPYIYGEEYDALLQRMENVAQGRKQSREILKKYTPEMIEAAKNCKGSWKRFVELCPDNAHLSPYQYKNVFDDFSTLNVKMDINPVDQDEKYREKQRLASIERDRKLVWGDLYESRHEL